MASHSYDVSTDLNVLTRDFLNATRQKAVFLRSPLLAKMFDSGRMTQKGGIKETVTIKYKQGFSEVQEYGTNDPLTSSVVNRRTMARFGLTKMQTPIRWSIDEVTQNFNAVDSARVANLLTEKVDDAHDATRDQLQDRLYRAATTEGGDIMNSLQTALTHDRTYGGLTRSTTATNEWWQGRSPDGSYTDQAGALAPNIPNFRAWRDVCDRYNDNPSSSKLVVCGDSMYRQFLAAAESRSVNTSKPGPTVKYGHESVIIDGVEFLKDKYLGADSTRAKYFFYLDVPSWQYEVDKTRNYKMTDAVWQGAMDGNADYWVQRIMTVHRFICTAPSRNMYLSNVS